MEINLNEFAEKQEADEQLKAGRESSNYPLSLKRIQWGPAHTTIFCEITGEAIRSYIPGSLRETVFNMFHKPAHPGSKVTDRLIRQRYVWPNMHRDQLSTVKNFSPRKTCT